MTATYGYDPAGRLTDVAQLDGGVPVQQTTLGYDPAGYRRSRQGTGTLAEFTLYLGEWVEQSVHTGETRRLVHATGIDDVMAEVTQAPDQPNPPPPVPRYLLHDGAGNVLHTADGGAALTTARYTAFGANRSGAVESERGFAGRPAEGATGLLYLRNRHYDPATGQFLQPDPLGAATDHPFAYAANNPYVYRDPLGLSAERISENESGPPASMAAEEGGTELGSCMQSGRCVQVGSVEGAQRNAQRLWSGRAGGAAQGGLPRDSRGSVIYDMRPLQGLLNERSALFDQAFGLQTQRALAMRERDDALASLAAISSPRMAVRRFVPLDVIVTPGQVLVAAAEAVVKTAWRLRGFERDVSNARERLHQAGVRLHVIELNLIAVEKRIDALDELILFRRLNSSQ